VPPVPGARTTRPPPPTSLPLFPASLPTVSDAYSALTAPFKEVRFHAHAAFVRSAMVDTGRPADAATLGALVGFRKALVMAWRLPCDNRVKEALWLLAANGFGGAHIRQWHCPCCTTPTTPVTVRGRLHAFWECHLALAVRAQLVAGLAAATPAIVVPVERAAVWLLRPPSGAVCGKVWAVVSMCAIAAMEFGRARTWATSLQGGAPVVNEVVAKFWVLLSEVVRDLPPLSAEDGWAVGPGHPFVFVPDDGRGRGRVRLVPGVLGGQ
jgi:hypothetical protein